MSQTDDDPLKRELTLLDSTMINVGTMIGSGIFIVPATIAIYAGSSFLVIGVWVLAGAVSLMGALCVAELSAAYPRAGGQFVYLEKAYGPLWGFLYGWTAFLVINTASIAAISVGFSTYLGHFLDMSPGWITTCAILSTIILTAINSYRLKLGAVTQDVFTFLKIGALIALCGLGLFSSSASTDNLLPIMPGFSPGEMAAPFALAMVAALWSYDGWIEITYIAGEVKNPGRNLPLSIIYSTVLVIALYTVLSYAAITVLTVSGMASSELVAADLASAVLGPIGAGFVVVAILIATIGANNGIVFTSARIPYAMAREGLFFKSLANVHPTFGTPLTALVVQCILSCLLTLSGTYDRLYTYVVFASWLFYAMSSFGVIVLRKKDPDVHRPYRTWGYPAVPILFVLFSIGLTIYTIIGDPVSSLIGGGIILLGIPVFYWWKRGRMDGDRRLGDGRRERGDGKREAEMAEDTRGTSNTQQPTLS
jgi:APA family basic amino acid/polyamine antiporter